MTHIHYHNDFTVPICLVSDSITINPDIICSITFYTRNNGNLYRCCRACNTLYVDENNVIAVLNAHNLEPGVLKYMVEYQIPDSKYPDGYQKICQHYTSNIDLTTQNGDITIAEAQIIYGDTIRELIESAGYSYTKEEVDEMIEGISAQVNTYTKPEIDSKLSTKANTADVYDKTTIDGMFENIDLPDNVVTDANYVHTDNNYTTTEKNKLSGIASGAEVNVQSDWDVTSTSSDAYIKNKPTKVSDFTNDAGYLTSETDPTVPAWAKAATKPTYTASEVGALPSSTVIPTVDSTITGAAQANPVRGGVIYTALNGKAGFKNYVDLEEMNDDTPANGTIGFDADNENFYIYDNANAEWKRIDGGGDLPANVVIDSNYVHTDNNFTTAYKNVIDGLPDSITTEKLTATTSVSSKEMVFTPYYADVPETNKIGLNVGFDEDNERSIFEFYDYHTQASLTLPIIDGAEFVTTAGFPVKETNADGSGTTQSSALKSCTYNVLQVRNTRVRTINYSLTQGNTSYILLIDNSYLSGFPSLTTLSFDNITITWEGGNAFDLATFRSGTDSYAIINLLKISDEVILGNYKLY